MKFTKPINREVEISGNTFVVSLDENGAIFRIKGKRRSTQVGWPQILLASTGEEGEPASDYLGLSKLHAVTSPTVASPESFESVEEQGEEEGSESQTETAMSASATPASES